MATRAPFLFLLIVLSYYPVPTNPFSTVNVPSTFPQANLFCPFLSHGRVLSSRLHASLLPFDTETDADAEEEEEAAFPLPLTPMDRALRAGKFWSSAVPGKPTPIPACVKRHSPLNQRPYTVIFNYYSTYAKLNFLDRVNPLLGRPCLSDEECEIIWSGLHSSGAGVLR